MPDVFKNMSLNEYYHASRGYFLRQSRDQEGLRKLYHLLWNANVGKADKIRDPATLRQHWPLLTDSKTDLIIQSQEMTERWERVLNKRKKIKNANSKPGD